MGRVAKKKLPFARTHINRIIKQYCPDKEVSKSARERLNKILGIIARDIVRDFNQCEMRRVDVEYLINISKEYREIQELRIMKGSVNAQLDELKEYVERIKKTLDRVGEVDV